MKLNIVNEYPVPDDYHIVSVCPTGHQRAAVLLSRVSNLAIMHCDGATQTVTPFTIERSTALLPTLGLLDCGIALLNGPSELLLFDRDLVAEPKRIVIAGSLPQKPNTTGPVHRGKPRYPFIKLTPPGNLGVTSSHILPVQVEFATAMNEGNHLALLQVVPAENRAFWLQSKYLELLHLDPTRMPQTPLSHLPSELHQPIIKHSLIDGERLLIFTPGDSVNIKYGLNYAAVVELTMTGEFVEGLWQEVYWHPGQASDERRHGKYGRFSQSREYCILHPMYKTDPWKSSRLLKLSDGSIIEPIFPHGHKARKLEDHGFNTFWQLKDDSRALIASTIE